MKNKFWIGLSIILICAILISGEVLAQPQSALISIHVLVLGESPNYSIALKKAMQIAKRSGVAFERMHTVYNSKKRHLEIPPQEGEPNVGYLGRAPGDCEIYTECISVEESNVYPTMKKGLFIVVGGVFTDGQDGSQANELLMFFKKFVPDAYLKKTTWDGSCPL